MDELGAYVDAYDQIQNVTQMARAGHISANAARGMMETIYNGASYIREIAVSPKLYEMMKQINGNLKNITYEMASQLWHAQIQKQAIEQHFLADKIVLEVPVYLAGTDVPAGFETKDNVMDVIKTLIHDGHKFVGKIHAIADEPYPNEQELFVDSIEFVRPSSRIRMRFEDEGDMIVVTAFKDEVDAKMAEFASSGANTMSGFLRSGSTSAARTQLGLGQASILQPAALGVSSRGMAQKTLSKKVP